MFLVNAYDLTIDPKNRLSIPNAIRSKMDADTDGRCFYVLPGARRTILNFYAERYYEKYCEQRRKANPPSKEAASYLLFEASMTALVEPDAQGRIVLPDRLLKFAGMGKDAEKEVVLVGAIDHLELWTQRDYGQFHGQMFEGYESIRERAMMELTDSSVRDGHARST